MTGRRIYRFVNENKINTDKAFFEKLFFHCGPQKLTKKYEEMYEFNKNNYRWYPSIQQPFFKVFKPFFPIICKHVNSLY